MRHRIQTIDYLRGLFALSILVYHFATWSGVGRIQVLQKFGVYGVAAFYVISGISFSYVYRVLRINSRGLASFYIKRFFRLAPLFWLIVAYQVAYQGLLWARGKPAEFPSLSTLALNLSLLFGVFDPSNSLVTGGWSIGNEVAFYCMFPLALIALRKGKWVFGGVLTVSYLVAAYFAFRVLRPDVPLGMQWDTYINPFNQVFLFLSGVAVATLIGRVTLSMKQGLGVLGLCVAVFILLPMGSDGSSIVTGASRFLFAGVCIGVCAVGALAYLPLPRVADRSLAWLGGASYAVYLLHPVVYPLAMKLLHRFNWPLVSFVGSAVLAVAAAGIVYRVIELPMIGLGKRIADRVERPNRNVPALAPKSARPRAEVLVEDQGYSFGLKDGQEPSLLEISHPEGGTTVAALRSVSEEPSPAPQ